MIQVIVVEDDEDLCDTLCRYLSRGQMQVRGALDAESLWPLLEAAPADVIVLDLNLPGESGFSAIQRLRRSSSAGLIVLTARAFREDRLQGLSLGADHYLLKPVDLQVLETIIGNLARRVTAPALDGAGAANDPMGTVSEADLRWELHRTHWQLLAPNRQGVLLSATEFHVLECLGAAPGHAFSRTQILDALGKPDIDVYRRNLDTTISRLRKRIEVDCDVALPIRAARGIGYAFVGQIAVNGSEHATPDVPNKSRGSSPLLDVPE